VLHHRDEEARLAVCKSKTSQCSGALGGSGGLRGNFGSGADDAARGGQGGLGGAGGTGGGGSGGAGGYSVGVAYFGSAPTLNAATFILGPAGSGASGGTQPGTGNQAATGPNGVSASTLSLP